MAEVLAALSAALSGDDQQAAMAGWGEAVEAGVDVEAAVLDASPAVQRWLIVQGGLTWRRLSRWRDTAAAHEVWLGALTACPEPEDAVAMVEEPAFLADAAHDPEVAHLALCAVSSLAYCTPAAARLLERLARLPSHPLIDRLVDRATLDVEVGAAYLDRGRPRLPVGVLALVAEMPLATPVRCRQILEEVRAALRAAPGRHLDQIAELARSSPVLVDALTHRMLDSVPHHRRVLPDLPPPLASQLGDRLAAASRGLPWLRSALVPLALIVGLVLAYSITLEVGDALTAGVVALGAVYLAEQHQYRREIRLVLAQVVVELGVTRACVNDWWRTGWKRAPRLARFSHFARGDHSLRLLSMIAAAVADEDGAGAGAGAGDDDGDDDGTDDDDRP